MRALVLVVLTACAGPSPAPPVTGSDLVVPPMPEAGPFAPRPLAKDAAPPEKLVSYEEALAGYVPPAPDPLEAEMTDSELSAPMRNAAFVSGCGAPDSMKVTVRVAVQKGRAVGVTVRTNPEDQSVARCVDGHVRSLRWPAKATGKMDSFTTTY